MTYQPLPIPPHFDPQKTGEVWRIDFQQRAADARHWAARHGIAHYTKDRFRLALLAVDVQNTFCIPGYELFVAGRSGRAAVNDNVRLAEFIYRHLGVITRTVASLDTHQAMQIFHPVCLIDENEEHPAPFTQISKEDVDRGRWRFNPAVAPSLGIDPDYGQAHLEHYVAELSRRKKFDLTVWPYHVMLGSISHAMAPAIAEAFFFHSMARYSQTEFEVKGRHPLTEHYSIMGPEVLTGPAGEPLADKNRWFVQLVKDCDALVIAGQAKSHCMAWTIDDLLSGIREHDEALAQKVYLLEDCTSPVVIPDTVDFTEQADAAFRRFGEAGMHLVRSTDPLNEWPGIDGG